MNIKNTSLKKAAAATMLACFCMSASAVPVFPPDVFTFQFSGGGATATGSFTTTDSHLGPFAGAFNASFAHVTALNVVVAGAPAGNGTFSRANFSDYFFMSNGALNFASNLAGQAHLTSFTLFGNSPAPAATFWFQITANGGLGVNMILSCLYLQGAGTCGAPAAPAPFVPYSTQRSNGAAAVLDALGGGTGSMATAITALAALTPAQQTAALEKLTPSPSRGVQVATQNSLFSAFDQIGLRLDGLRLADGTFNAPSLAVGGGVGLASGDEPAKHGFWFKAYGLEGSQGQKDGFAGYKSSGWGVAAGADRQFAPGLIGGVALSYSDTALSYQDQLSGNSNGITSTQLSVYGSQDFGRAYVDGILAYAQQKYDSRRDTVVSGIANGSYDGDQWGVRIGAGLPIPLSHDFSVTPQARIEWNRVYQKAYTENGGGALALSVASNSAERVRSSIGAQLNHDTSWGGVKEQPFIRAFWHHDFKNNGIDSAASFVGGGSTFTTPGQKLDQDTYSVGLGANFFTRDNFTATLAYDLTMGSSYQAHTAQATARWAF